ncbi:hypothetical protein E2562_027246 [Oryza meyeriana var. granulata]|uniref:Secreted protein n=1 Tax=Oryza meyeriana var. granulata TaxID=110450 RepID=A0A6G1CSB4_9ORYZ|nr:hypothetical protein E2562_027246 [Oryza meyeriana var. granulata]
MPTASPTTRLVLMCVVVVGAQVMTRAKKGLLTRLSSLPPHFSPIATYPVPSLTVNTHSSSSTVPLLSFLIPAL